jgi:hypothetical protein
MQYSRRFHLFFMGCCDAADCQYHVPKVLHFCKAYNLLILPSFVNAFISFMGFRWLSTPQLTLPTLALQRKSGAIEPERDADGNEINPHIPQYMAAAPWYLNAQGPGLKHQKDFRKQSVTQVGRLLVVHSSYHVVSIAAHFESPSACMFLFHCRRSM